MTNCYPIFLPNLHQKFLLMEILITILNYCNLGPPVPRRTIHNGYVFSQHFFIMTHIMLLVIGNTEIPPPQPPELGYNLSYSEFIKVKQLSGEFL